MTRRVLAAIVLLAAVAGGVWWWRWERPAAESLPAPTGTAGAARYQCAMHPQIVSDKPGNCPICGMELTPVHEEHAAPAPPVGTAVGPVPGRSLLHAVGCAPAADRRAPGARRGTAAAHRGARQRHGGLRPGPVRGHGRVPAGAAGAGRARRQHAARGAAGRRRAGARLSRPAPPEGRVGAAAGGHRPRRRGAAQPAAARQERLGVRAGLRVRARTDPSRAVDDHHRAVAAGTNAHCARRRHRSRSSIPPRARHGCVRSYRRRTASCGRRASSTS